MSSLSEWLGYGGFILCLALMIFGLFAPRARAATIRPRRSTVLLAFFVFLAVWLWLRAALPLLAWGLWIGDNQHWFYDYSWLIAACVALAFSIRVAGRGVRGSASTRYLRLHFWCSLALLAIIGTIWSYEMIEPIEGTTPEAAAQSVLRRVAPSIDEPVRLVEDKQPSRDFAELLRCRTYWIMGKDEPRSRLTVCRYGRYWWQFASSERFPPPATELGRAKKWLQDPTNRDHAPHILNDIVKNYPETPEAKEAQQLLKGIEKANAPSLDE